MRQADVTVSESAFEEMGIDELLSLGRDAGLREVTELSCHGTGAVVQATVESRYDEAALSELSYVEEWTHVAETSEGHVYVISFTAPGLPERLAAESEELVGTCDPELGDQQASMSLVGPQASIAGTIDAYESAGVPTALTRLGSYEGGAAPTDTLTDRQREVLETAFEMGYYDVPRAASADAVAAELGLDDSTVVEHLQRAERNLIGHVLE